jgi:LysR family transcriptional regulator, nitrogen assimilation regulatory protein
MEIESLRYFVRVAELGSVSRAAESLNAAQPRLSRHIRQIETALGVSLFVRHGRGVELTERGKLFFEHAKGILHQWSHARAVTVDATATLSGRFVLGLPPSLCKALIVPLIHSLKGQHPALQLIVREGLSVTLLDWLASGSLDCAVTYNAAAGSQFALESLGTELRYLIARRGTPEGARARVTVAQLARTPLIVPARPHSTRLALERLMLQHRLNPRIAAEIDGIPAILEMVRAGMGCALLPRAALRDASAGLVAVPVSGGPISSEVFIATSARRPDAQAQRAVTHALRGLVPKLLK